MPKAGHVRRQGGAGDEGRAGEEDEDASELRKGMAVAGRWVLEREIGRGGFGTVWSARPLRGARASDTGPLAIKFERCEDAPKTLRGGKIVRHAETKSDIMQEHQILMTLLEDDTRGVLPPVKEGFYGPGQHVEGCSAFFSLMAMPRLAGSLEKVTTTTPYAFVKLCGHEMLTTLREAHELGIVHRDVSDGNIMLGDDGSFFLVDWGLSARYIKQDGTPLARMQRYDDGTFNGTAEFVSQSVLEGGANTPRDDLESLVLTLINVVKPLPWKHIRSSRNATRSTDAQMERLLDLRRSMRSPSEICAGMPKSFERLLKTVQKSDDMECNYEALHMCLDNIPDDGGLITLHWEIESVPQKPKRARDVPSKSAQKESKSPKRLDQGSPRSMQNGKRVRLLPSTPEASGSIWSGRTPSLRSASKYARLQEEEKASRGQRKKIMACTIM